MRKINLLQLLIALLPSILLSINLQAQKADNDVITVSDNIEYSYFFKHLKYLASDELKGRDIGSEGYAKAADYVADEFKKNGLLPFGDSGTYFQKVILSKPTIVKSSFQFQIEKNSESITGLYGENITFVLNPKYEKINEKQKMVFVGYGNILPKENINDYEGVDVKGKMVIVAMGGPKDIKNSAINDLYAKCDNAIAQGASGIILFIPGARVFQNMIFKGFHGYLSKEMMFLADTSVNGFAIDLTIAAFSKRKFINEIFKLNGLNLKKELKNIAKGNNSSSELKTVLTCSYDVNIENISCKNVVAILPGIDTTLKSEYLVIGAHLDHLGVGKIIKGDSIYNGMVDNASGSAAILSIAKAYNSLSEKPKRSVIFVCFTAEEKGFLGSDFYVNRNNVNDGKIVANLNMDMLGFGFETIDIMPLGYSHSNLSEAIDFATGSLSMKVDDNKQIEKKYFEQGDQISFIKNRIPALSIESGFSAVDTKINGKKRFNNWMKKKYHSTSDDLNQKYSDKSFLTLIKANFLTAYYISNTLEEIKWNEKSWIYEKYVLQEKN